MPGKRTRDLDWLDEAAEQWNAVQAKQARKDTTHRALKIALEHQMLGSERVVNQYNEKLKKVFDEAIENSGSAMDDPQLSNAGAVHARKKTGTDVRRMQAMWEKKRYVNADKEAKALSKALSDLGEFGHLYTRDGKNLRDVPKRMHELMLDDKVKLLAEMNGFISGDGEDENFVKSQSYAPKRITFEQWSKKNGKARDWKSRNEYYEEMYPNDFSID